MRKFLIITGLCLSFFTSAQDSEIKATLNSYFQLMEKKEISEALDYIHPSLMGMLGKELFEQQYDQLFNSPGLEVDIDQFAIDTVSDLYQSEESKYALVDYSFRMTFKVDVSKDSTGLLSDILLGSYQSKFGQNNVTLDGPGTYLIHTPRQMFAIREPEFEGWKILDYEDGMRIILVDIIPEAVLTHFKK